MTRGYFGIGVYQPKNSVNIGTLWRSAHNFGAAFIFTVGARYKRQPGDTTAAWKTIPLFEYTSMEDCLERPRDCFIVAVEQCDGAGDLRNFAHPDRVMYLLGAEDRGVPSDVLKQCQRIVQIDTPMCLNVAVAGSIVMYDRAAKA